MSITSTGLSSWEEPGRGQSATGPRGPPNRAAFSISETAELLGVCQASVYRALKRGELEAVTLGGRRLIPARCIDKLLTGKAA